MLHPQPASDKKTPRVIALGGVDPGCGAGIGRDLLAAHDLGAQAVLVGTAWTEQSPAGVAAIEPRSAGRVQAALQAALQRTAGLPTAVKVGMVARGDIASAITEALTGFEGPVVFDPVLAASSGGALYTGDLNELAPLLRRATLVTPNLGEAARLLELDTVGSTLDDALKAAWALRERGVRSVLVKGGHMSGDPVDVLLQGGDSPASNRAAAPVLLGGPRIPGASPRGTGCSLATAIATYLALGHGLESAVRAARTWLLDRIAKATDRNGERQLG